MGRVDNVEELFSELGCKVGSLPSAYLGLPLGALFKSMATWDRVEERFRKRLIMWKRQYISKGGRINLIRSTLSSLKIYFISLLCTPRMVRLRLETSSSKVGNCLLRQKERGDWGLSVFLLSIWLSFANGADVLQIREGPLRIK